MPSNLGIVASGMTEIAALLGGMEAFWEGTSYSGSGNWLNKGTVGSPMDLVRTGTTFTTDHFTLNGTSDVLSSSTTNPAFLLYQNDAADMSVGLILKHTSSPIANRCYWSQDYTFAGTTYHEMYDNSGFARFQQQAPGQVGYLVTSTGGTPVGSKFLLAAAVYNYTPGIDNLNHAIYCNGIYTTGTANRFASGGDIKSPGGQPWMIGNGNLRGFQSFEVYAGFRCTQSLTQAQFAGIAAYYGAT